MNTGKIKAMLLIIVVLLAVAFVCAFVTGGETEKPSTNLANNGGTITVPAVPTADPSLQNGTTAPANTSAPGGTAPNNTPMPGNVSNPTPTPTPTPTATPEPTPTPKPAETAAPVATTAPSSGNSIASGNLSASTGTGLDMRAEWSVVVTGTNSATVTVNVYAVSYSIYLNESDSALQYTLGSQKSYGGTPAVSSDNNSQHSTLIGTKSFSVDTSKGTVSLPLNIVWQYSGSYGGTAIDTIECSGTVAFG